MDTSKNTDEIKSEGERELLNAIFAMVKKEQDEHGKSFNEACGYVLSDFFEHRNIAGSLAMMAEG
jgi:hypothetical protein